ncbi:MAG: peroxiredoxin [Pseudomonadota bacterium]
MSDKKISSKTFLLGCVIVLAPLWTCWASTPADSSIYNPGNLKPMDTSTGLKIGDLAPAFSLPTLSGGSVSLDQYRNKNNVVLSFVPAAWTPVCSQQWPGYNIARDLFEKLDTVVIGISVDNIPTLHAWTKEMGNLWFPVASDFWPHGAVAQKYGILRSDGVSERALFVIDKKGIVRYVDVHDINKMPKLENLIKALEKLRQN